jgi:hypothetical protein
MRARSKVQGEGRHAAARRYSDATKKFVQAGRVEQAARDAEPTSEADALQMAAAEAEGRRRAKEEDPAFDTPGGSRGGGSRRKFRQAGFLGRNHDRAQAWPEGMSAIHTTRSLP